MKILVVCAHMDDEMFGFGGSLFKLSINNEVRVITLCHGRINDDGQNERTSTYFDIMSELGVSCDVHPYFDLSLDKIDFVELNSLIGNEVKFFRPDIVFSNSDSDIHRDHVIVADATKVACRPMSGCSVKELYQFAVPASSQWGFNQDNYNVCFDITNYIDQKLEWCGRYNTEIKNDDTHPNSLNGIRTFNGYVGNIFGFKYGELCKLVYKRSL
jgi:LmbE family N-acetylglucosaminyl deacetylase